MTTNRDWLFSLPLEEQYAWMNAEHAESPTSATMQHIGQVIEDTVKRGVYGDTEPENADSRERLEADAKRYIEHAADYAYEDTLWADETFTLYDAIIELLDRQAAITANETSHDNPYVGLVRGKQWERTEISDYYCGSCGWKVTDHDSYCSECGGALHKAPNKPDGQFDAPKSVETSENPASKCEISDFDDSREQLEADIRQYANPEGNTATLGACWERKMFEFLDRQAAITEREYGERMASEAMCSNVCAVVCEQRGHIAELQVKVDELTAERDKLQEQLLIGWECECRLQAERERYRNKFGKCLDYADAIHALMDDEGMA